MTKEVGLKECINGDNEGGGGDGGGGSGEGSSSKKNDMELSVYVSGGGQPERTSPSKGVNKENKKQEGVPLRKVSVGEPMGLPNEQLLPPPPNKAPTNTTTDQSSTPHNNGLKRPSLKNKCRCWCCCCCSCSGLALSKNSDSKGKEAESDLICDPDPPPSLEEIRSWGDSFDKLMRNSGGRKAFRDFLKCEYSEENILFWLACEELKKERTPEAIEEKARLIYEDYISILSPKEVSLDSRVRDVVNQNMRNPKPSTFDEAQLQIYTLMHRDSYPRFVNSPLYKKLAQLNSTPTETPSGNPLTAPGSHRGSMSISSPASRKQSAAS